MTVLYIIIGITVVVSLLAFNNAELAHRLKFNAYYIKHDNEAWRFLTYGLVHADWIHLFINMYVLYSFGQVVLAVFQIVFPAEAILYFLMLYLGGIVFSTLIDFRNHKDNIYYNAVGASGAVSAIVFSSIIIYPQGSIYLFFIPIPIPSFIFGILYLVYSAYMAKRGKDNIGHNAHF